MRSRQTIAPLGLTLEAVNHPAWQEITINFSLGHCAALSAGGPPAAPTSWFYYDPHRPRLSASIAICCRAAHHGDRDGPPEPPRPGAAVHRFDGFKLINDNLGHNARAICCSSCRRICIRHCLRPGLAIRLGQTSFWCCFRHQEPQDLVGQLIERLQHRLHDPADIGQGG